MRIRRSRGRYLVSGHPELDRIDPIADVMSNDKYPEENTAMSQ